MASAESACPFCGASREVSSPASARLGRVSRAAVFAGVALASSACGGKKPKAEPIDNQQTQTAPVDAAVPVEESPRDNSNIPMPYGAPPARRRVV